MDQDALDLKDLMLQAEAEVQAIIRESMQELQLPMMLNALHMQWMTLPDQLKEKLRKEQPEAYQVLMDTLGNETNPKPY